MNNVTRIMKRISWYTLGIAFTLALIIFAWEQFRPGFVALFTVETVSATRTVEPPTDLELFMAREDVKDQIIVMMKKDQRKALDDEIASLEGLQ